MSKAILISSAVFLMMVGQAIGDGQWANVEILPQHPTSSDVVVITLSGWWGSSCIPRASAISVIGNNIYFDVISSPQSGCYGVITPWELRRSVGPLPPRMYILYARIVGVPFSPDTYTWMMEFSVTPDYHVDTIYYVDAVRGDDNNDGQSKEAAFATIQKAIDTAKSGDTVIVADGTYTGPGNRDIDFLGKAITVRSESGPENCIIDCNGTKIRPHRAFQFRSNEDANSILAGFAITNGYTFGLMGAPAGGGIVCDDYSSPRIINCKIRDNSTWSFGGGIYCSDFSNPTIQNCSISGNLAGGKGGGIYAYHNSNPKISNSTIVGNRAQHGGGFYCSKDSNLTITKCKISNNSARFRGGGIYARDSNTVITDCTINRNLAGWTGNGIFLFASNAKISNSTFVENLPLAGHALTCDSWTQQHPSNLQISNCIFWDGGNEIWNNDNSTITITYSDVQGGWSGEGNIDADPCFVEPGYWDANDTSDDVNDDFWVEGDYYLLPDSLCIDAGDPNYIPEPNETDIDGNPRVINGRIDMGAYESNYIQAAMKLTPQTLNCNSKGKYVKAHITLPEEFLPQDVDVNEPAVAEPMGAYSESIKVIGNDDGPVRLEICFDRETFCAQITETGEVEITVIGPLTTGQYFSATDTIRIKPRR